MSEFFKAAAHCDITVVRKAPIPINEKAIIEEEIAARQWDTLAEKVAMEQELRQQVRNAELEQIRQREQEERMRKLRLEERRKEAIKQKEAERGAKQEIEARKHEDLETQRLAVIEAKRLELEAEREQSRIKAQEKAYEEVQKRLQRAAEQNAGRFSEQPLPEDDAAINYMTRLRVEKDRLGRADKLFPGSSINAVYSGNQQEEGASLASSQTQLERDIVVRREAERARLQREIDEIRAEEAAVAEFEHSQRLAAAEEKLSEHTAWLRAYQQEDEEKERLRLENTPQPQGKHIIDVLHETVRAEFMREQEAEALLEENLRDGGSHLDRLEHYLEAEKDAWREQRQFEHEVDKENQEYIE